MWKLVFKSLSNLFLLSSQIIHFTIIIIRLYKAGSNFDEIRIKKRQANTKKS